MIAGVLFLFFSSFLFQSDVSEQLIYPELNPILYFDPNLQEYECNILDLADCKQNQTDFDALNRLSALFHETFAEFADNALLLNFLPQEEKGFIIDTAPNGKSLETELTIYIDPDEQYWLFHDGSPITVEDIFYSIHYASRTQKNIPSLYSSGEVKISLLQKENKLKILYKFPIPRALIVNHLSDLIILPAKNIIDFYETGGHNRETIIKKYMRDEMNVNSIESANAAGPFRIGPDQDDKTMSVKLYRFEDYGRYFSSNADIEKIHIRWNERQSDWYTLLEKGEYNLAINISGARESNNKTGAKVRKLGSYEVSSLMVNQNNKYLKQKLFRKAIAIAIDKEFIRTEVLKAKVKLINGPYSKMQETYSWKIIEDHEKFHQIMKDLGYTRSDKYSDYKDSNNEFIELDILYFNSKKDKNNALTNQILDAICQQLNDLGLRVKKDAREFEGKALEEKLNNAEFDLYYNVTTIKNTENMKDHYSIDGKNNYGKYKPSKDFNDNIIALSRDCGSPQRCNIRKEEVWNQLAKDYVNIYLWSPDYFYAYNSNYIRINPFLVDSDQFFQEPHNWDIFPD